MQQKIIIGFVLTLFIVIFIPIYGATESGRHEAARERLKAEAVEIGAELYTSMCAICHGPQGEGKVGPALKGTELDDDTLAKLISRGILGTAMPAFGDEEDGSLKDHQIRDLVTFIKNWDSALLQEALAAEVTKPTPTPTATSTLTPTVEATPSTIDAAPLYSAQCGACHGANREGVSGLGPALTPESLTALGDTEIAETISNGKPGTSMAGFKGRLSAEIIDALMKFIKYTSP